jgi:hypothetical protein
LFCSLEFSRPASEPTQLPSIKRVLVMFRGLKWLGSEADRLSSTSIEDRNVWSYTSAPHMPLWQACGYFYLYNSGFNKSFAYHFRTSEVHSKLCCVFNL